MRLGLAVQGCICNVCFFNLDDKHVYSLHARYAFGITKMFHNKNAEQTNFQLWDDLAKSISFPKRTDRVLNF